MADPEEQKQLDEQQIEGEDEESDEDDDEDDHDDDDEEEDDDNGFEFANQQQADNNSGDPNAASQMVSNQHFDEAMSVSEDEESVDDSVSMDQQQAEAASEPPQAEAAAKAGEPAESDEEGSDEEGDSEEEDESDEEQDEQAYQQQQQQQQQQLQLQQQQYKQQQEQQQQQQRQQKNDEEDDDDDDDDDEDGSSSEEESSSEEDEDSGIKEGAPGAAKAYNPAEYAHINVSADIQGLFGHIARHKPADMELDTKLRPFIPDFIPAVGQIDNFLKIPPPDQSQDFLGLKVLDEPSANQSDPTVLDIKIRVMSKQTGLKPMTVRSIEHADKHPKKVTTWINNIEDVHRKKPPPSVNYSKPMPDIEDLMQVWPSEFEELLKTTPLPGAELDMELQEFVKVVCAILDIPVYEKLTESLHVLFTLYTEFKTNSHFQQL